MKNITYDKNQKIFHLKSAGVSYIMQVYKEGYLGHIYWGKEVDAYRNSYVIRTADRAFSPNPNKEDRAFSLDTIPQEYPAFGHTDFRIPSVRIEMPDGTHITDFRYESHLMELGKPKLEGLPQTYINKDNQAETLIITLKDSLYELYLELSYTIFQDYPVITRSVKLINKMEESVKILKLSSANIDFREEDYELVHLAGAWGRERRIARQSIDQGIFEIESRRGASSHHHNPFFAIVSPDTTETNGLVYSMNFVYSGDFLAQIEQSSLNTIRVNMGLNPFTFNWLLQSNESFQTPEVVLNFSDQGLGKMSRTYHSFYRNHLLRGELSQQERPTLINNWEATYFDFDEQKILDIAKESAKAGIELFVLDDGWFGKRNSDTSSLGDWFLNKEKLPNGLQGLSNEIHKMNMKFGIWVEPEMISVESELYKKHPDWCLHVEGRRKSESRNQLILDMSRSEVAEYIYQAIDDVLSSANIDYVKWDMNRNMTEAYSIVLGKEQKLETAHRYMLGLYDVLERLTTKHSNILFESCSGGGGRFDPGMLYYMPQVWTSDNTDAVCRTKIQYGTSMVYPVITMGSHVSAVPNHQVDRITSMKFRGDVAMSGNFGYELDITKSSKEDILEIEHQVKMYKEHRHIVQFGELYRIKNPFDSSDSAIMYVTEDKSEALVFYYKVLAYAQESFIRIKLKGLKENGLYQTSDEMIFGGDELMNIGIDIPNLHGDFNSHVIHLKLVK